MAWCGGVAFGLAIAAKFSFLPLAAGGIVAVAALQAGINWRSLAQFGTTKVLWEYLAIASFIFAGIVFLEALGSGLPLPIFETGPTAQHILVGLTILFVPMLFVVVWHSESTTLKHTFSGLLKAVRSLDPWILGTVTVLTFLVILTPFLLATPSELITQSVIYQMNREGGLLPSYLGNIDLLLYTPGLLRLYVVPVLASVPILYLLLRSPSAVPMRFILVIGLGVTFLGLQVAFQTSRYAVSLYPFLALGIATLFTASPRHLTASKLVALGAIILLLVSLSLRVTFEFQGYDISDSFANPPGVSRYAEVRPFLATIDPDAKVYSTSPMLLGLSPEFQTVPNWDTFGHLWLARDSASQFVDDVLQEDADFVGIDPWVRRWGFPMKLQLDEVQALFRERGVLLQVVGSSDDERFEIYAVRKKDEVVFNGDFSRWLPKARAPLGWEAISNTSGDNETLVELSEVKGQSAVELTVHQTSAPSPGDSTHVRIRQTIPFPTGPIQLQVYPTFSYADLADLPLIVAGVEVSDGENPLIWYSLADNEGHHSYALPNGHHIEVLGTPLNQWSTISVDIEETYRQLGWHVPDQVMVDLFLVVHVSRPGTYSVFFGSVESVDAGPR